MRLSRRLLWGHLSAELLPASGRRLSAAAAETPGCSLPSAHPTATPLAAQPWRR